MKEIRLESKGTYEEIVEYIYQNYDITEPTKFTFTKVVRTNAKQRRRKEFKDVYQYEEEGTILLNDNNHKKNLLNKVIGCVGSSYVDFNKWGID